MRVPWTTVPRSSARVSCVALEALEPRPEPDVHRGRVLRLDPADPVEGLRDWRPRALEQQLAREQGTVQLALGEGPDVCHRHLLRRGVLSAARTVLHSRKSGKRQRGEDVALERRSTPLAARELRDARPGLRARPRSGRNGGDGLGTCARTSSGATALPRGRAQQRRASGRTPQGRSRHADRELRSTHGPSVRSRWIPTA